jgi:PRTRC genetic system protein B
MNEVDFSIHAPTVGVLKLDRAVLIYRGSAGSALATIHAVHDLDGELVIGAGEAVTPRATMRLAQALLKRAAHGGFLPDTVLYVNADLILWHVPPARRHIAFRVDAAHAGLLGGEERGETVPHPGLVFAASSRGWRVWAVKGSRRPTPDTALFQAPYFNTDEQGHICQGTTPVPEGTTADKIDAWTEAFFRSYFTHPSGRSDRVRYSGGAYAFWRDMLDGAYTRFPPQVLVPCRCTLGALLGMKGKC